MSLQERRERLVDAAIRVMARAGVHAATTRAIVGEAGMPLASFHYAFESHSELMREVILKTVDAEMISAGSQELDGPTLEETIRRGLVGYLDHLRADPRSEQAQMELRHYALRSHDHRGLVTEMVEKQYAWVEAALKKFAAGHNVVYKVPVRQIAIHLMVVAEGLTLSVLSSGDSDLLRASLEPICQSFAGYVREQ